MFAYTDMTTTNFTKMNNNFSQIEQDLTILGMFGLKDPIKPKILNSVRICQQANIKVIMVTGDNMHTANAIAK